MCLSPIRIPNPNKARYLGKAALNQSWNFEHLKDNQSDYINVPCGVCKQCIFQAQMELVQRVQMESMYNYIFMGTTTYKEEALPRITLPDWEDEHGYLHEGYTYRYAKYQDASETIKRMRGNNVFGVPFKFLVVTERGGKRQRPHFHWLLLFKKEDIGNYHDVLNFEAKHKWTLLNNWKRNQGSRHYPLYQELCEYHENYRGGKLRRNYDFHYVNPILSKGGVTDVAFYVLKYMLKGMDELSTRRAIKKNYDASLAWDFWQKVKNRREYSLGFGLDIDYSKRGKDRSIKEEMCNPEIIKYLKDGVQRSLKAKEEYAFYYCPENLLTFPLAEYYKKFPFIYNNDLDFYNINPAGWEERMKNPERLHHSQVVKQMNDFERILQETELQDIADTFDELEF